MVIAAPRSGTAWVSTWLTTDTTLCLHDPLTRWHYRALDGIQSEKTLGVSCTGLALFPSYVNAHPARKVILHRDQAEIVASIKRLGISGGYDVGALDRIKGKHVGWREIFDNPKPLYEFLTQKPFDADRHRELLHMNVQRSIEGKWYDTRLMQALQEELRGAQPAH